jgi:ketosteroid isomerase-like protein
MRCAVLSAILLLATSATYAAPVDLANMVQAEYAFSDMAKAEGYKASFLKYLAPDAIMFFNGPVQARKRVSERPDLQGVLQWYPDYAIVSSSGDVGLSTGPWVYTNAGKPSAYGHFFSIWRKQRDGSWRNALDVGIDHDEIQPPPTKLKVSAPMGHADTRSTKGGDTTAAIREAEAQFAQLAIASSYAAAAEHMAHADLRVYRDGHAPVVGAVTAVAYLKDLGPVGAPKIDAALGSGDFGYAYGMIARRQGAGASHAFVHVWKEEGGKWQLLGDLLTPVVEPKAQ